MVISIERLMRPNRFYLMTYFTCVRGRAKLTVGFELLLLLLLLLSTRMCSVVSSSKKEPDKTIVALEVGGRLQTSVSCLFNENCIA